MGTVSSSNGVSYGAGSNSDPSSVNPTASPFIFIAPSNGIIFFTGGTAVGTQYQRNNTLMALGLSTGSIFIQVGDSIKFTYVTPPTITFVSF